ncbi:MAG: uracil-DNA glycosylase [Bryobacteraceae bacterium]|nr:uracil-DNA glycosylase [Bryobacteraceae bacterium]
MHELELLQQEIIGCSRCPRLRAHCSLVAEVKRRAYREENYWGRPVPSFGDPAARVLILGLAPGAHGANRTGRMFTGDSSGDLLYRVLYNTGFASQPSGRSAGDGLQLNGAYITASAHCAPPDNKPAREEILACRSYLQRELELLTGVVAVVALGRIAFDNYLAATGERKSRFVFAHNLVNETGSGKPKLIASFHPSQQNTSTGKLTEPMLEAVFITARRLAYSPAPDEIARTQ